MPDQKVEILLRDGSRICGKITGYYASDADNPNSPILFWRIADGTGPCSQGYNGILFEKGKLIRHSDIVNVSFEADHRR